MQARFSIRKLSKRDRRALAFLGVVGAAILVLLGVVLPFYDAKGGIQDELREKEGLLRRYIQVIREEEIHRAELVELDRVVGWYQDRLLDAQDTNIATIQLEEVVRSLAAENGIQVTRSNPLQQRKMGDHYVKITLQINLRSDMSQLANFLYALSAHPKFFLVENFFLNSFRSREEVRIQPRMNVSGFIRLS